MTHEFSKSHHHRHYSKMKTMLRRNQDRYVKGTSDMGARGQGSS
ncbi:hypothetical protein M8C21_033600 [Ambrosia artemisiifolia]|uniref:Uncharacterized protein n=1 Tax=Ambrosia artemisiifolia TaxID=4212 RepID=A0AAD5DA16_AMBAR|nr:hypothetical protein M8C21_033600 [Ambrosia artemisiifolia]